MYVQAQLVGIMSLELHYNSPDGFDKYMYIFEDICGNLEACYQGLIESHKHTFSLNGIKDRDF